MAKNQKEKPTKKPVSKPTVTSSIKNETKQAILAVVFFVLAIVSLLASIHTGTASDTIYYAGPVGKIVYEFLSILLGIGYFLIPLFFLMLSISFFKAEEKEFDGLKFFGGILFFISGIGMIDLIS